MIYMNNLDKSKVVLVTPTAKVSFEKEMSIVRALILLIGVYFILHLAYNSENAQILGLIQTIVTENEVPDHERSDNFDLIVNLIK